MRKYELHAEQWLPVTIDKAYEFFSSPSNLATITPPDLDFVIITEGLAPEIFTGMKIRYYVKPLLGVRVKWETEITDVQKPFSFVDRQVSGPYKFWEHRHTFVPQDSGVLVIDHVEYALPFGFLGAIAHSLVVRKRLDYIFRFRKEVLMKIFT
jgi:ligand-binding SRPBCC domain-containing protein